MESSLLFSTQSWSMLPKHPDSLLGRVAKSMKTTYLYMFFFIKCVQQTGFLGELEGLRGLQCWKSKPVGLRAVVDSCGHKAVLCI